MSIGSRMFSDEFSTEGMELQFSQYQHQNTPVASTDKVCSGLRYRNTEPLGHRYEYTRGFPREVSLTDTWCMQVHVSNAEVLQRSGLSTIVDILRHRCLSLFGHVARLDPGVPAHDALRLMVATCIYEGRKLTGQLEKTAGSPLQRLAQQGSGGCQRSTAAIYAVEIWDRRGSRSSGSLRVRDDDDDDDDNEGCKTCVKNGR